MKALCEELCTCNEQHYYSSLEAEKEILMKANAEIKSTIEGKEDVIMTRWKDVHLKETPKITQRHSNTMDVLDAKEQYEIGKNNNIFTSS